MELSYIRTLLYKYILYMGYVIPVSLYPPCSHPFLFPLVPVVPLE